MTLSLAQALPRFGVKGRAAADWLTAQGVPLPAAANRWLSLPEHNRVLRLGRGEYLIEGLLAQQLDAAWQGAQPDVYRVPRYDAGFVLNGPGVSELLAEICALDTRPQVMGDQVLMTLAAGISVTLVCETDGAEPVYRLWCDATYGTYLQATLQEILG